MRSTALPLVRPMFSGPVDVVGDVHGEIDALHTLLARLGYDEAGDHPAGRRLIFVGDLIDRGPDSPAVLRKVRALMDAGRAQCVMGNHELNLLAGKVRVYNHWFHHGAAAQGHVATSQALLPAGERQELLDFLAGLPLALERDDLRVVHACWDDAMVDVARASTDVLALKSEREQSIRDRLVADGVTDPVDCSLACQNGCPVKVMSSGKEHRSASPFFAGERERYEARTPWWGDYTDAAFCVFGHYSRTTSGLHNGEVVSMFPDDPFAAVGRTMCIDLGVGGRAAERRGEQPGGAMHLAAFRWPEQVVMTDTGTECVAEGIA